MEFSIADVLTFSRGFLKNSFEAELLLGYAVKKPREFLIAHPEYKIARRIFEKFKKNLLKRKEGVPIPYLTHEKEFYGIKLYVDKRCLIPRPETELLVDLVLERVRVGDKILDVGTGSGAIAIALSAALASRGKTTVQVFACDISRKALKVAKINIKKHKLKSKIKLYKSNLIPVKTRFRVIVANLPYVEEKIKTFEPEIALCGGLSLYEKLFKQILALKYKPRFLICEFGYNQKRRVANLLKKYFPESEVKFFKDLASIYRVFVLKF